MFTSIVIDGVETPHAVNPDYLDLENTAVKEGFAIVKGRLE